MQKQSNRVGVIGGVRIPFARHNTAYAEVGNFGMSVKVLGALVERFGLHGQELGEVALGAVMKHASDWNLAREALLSSGLAPTTPGITTARACGTSLDNAIVIGNKIAMGQIQSGIACGSDTTSDVPIELGTKLRKRLMRINRARSPMDKVKAAVGDFSLRELKPKFPGVGEPRTGKSMGEHCEAMAREWQITREAQDQLALESHQKLAAAYEEGFFDDLLVPFRKLKRDGFLRADTSLEKMASLKPVFDRSSGHGTLTAGNSTGLSDGAAAVLMGSDAWAQQHGLKVQAYLTHARVAAVDFVHGEGLLMAPTIAVPRMLDEAGLTLKDFDFYEIHEAFAAQVLCTLKAWESTEYCRERLGRDQPLGSIDRDKLNVHGSSLAVGHPFAATGARIIATLAKMLEQRGSGRGLISICTAGGMGVTAILERP
ncbi:acetyl-CoA C-acetyltransferase [Oleiagrimonas sp.]|jgi:acetyl-CoA C-acetyltransferase|uniref:acetyl-CoA C-acetyltransferase n=1 Tax=Oleiagrimonas sp. TaxID=2010330 RepID=UPI00262FB915|nr:acetyl-CoA C-acetyltransferase [Oleiagrimonas sp.]MDA3914147.1 acetyl-CoA C-acetyltransferase [Oleiagrimonas sp.]